MNKKILVLHAVIFLGLSMAIYQFSGAYFSAPNPGHSWSEIECSEGLCIIGTGANQKVGIGTDAPSQKLTVNGTIKSSSGGFEFPDGTIQTTKTLAGPTGPQGATGATGETGPAGSLPPGMIVMFATACPSGWTRFAALDDRVPRGAVAYGATGGAVSNSAACGISPISNCSLMSMYGTSLTTGWVPYLDVIWCQKN